MKNTKPVTNLSILVRAREELLGIKKDSVLTSLNGSVSGKISGLNSELKLTSPESLSDEQKDIFTRAGDDADKWTTLYKDKVYKYLLAQANPTAAALKIGYLPEMTVSLRTTTSKDKTQYVGASVKIKESLINLDDLAHCAQESGAKYTVSPWKDDLLRYVYIDLTASELSGIFKAAKESGNVDKSDTILNRLITALSLNRSKAQQELEKTYSTKITQKLLYNLTASRYGEGYNLKNAQITWLKRALITIDSGNNCGFRLTKQEALPALIQEAVVNFVNGLQLQADGLNFNQPAKSAK